MPVISYQLYSIYVITMCIVLGCQKEKANVQNTSYELWTKQVSHSTHALEWLATGDTNSYVKCINNIQFDPNVRACLKFPAQPSVSNSSNDINTLLVCSVNPWLVFHMGNLRNQPFPTQCDNPEDVYLTYRIAMFLLKHPQHSGNVNVDDNLKSLFERAISIVEKTNTFHTGNKGQGNKDQASIAPSEAHEKRALGSGLAK
jgi:hypothetical protein